MPLKPELLARLDPAARGFTFEPMDVAKIQREVLRLRPSQRKKLTAWMVSEFPVLSVDGLMAKAPHGAVPPDPTAAAYSRIDDRVAERFKALRALAEP